MVDTPQRATESADVARSHDRLVFLAFARSARLVRARNRQEAALEHSTRFYTALAENSSDAVIVVDAEGLIMNDAPNLAAMMGRAGESTTGMDAITFLRPADQDGAREVLDRWLATRGVVTDSEVQTIQADGSEKWFGLRAPTCRMIRSCEVW